MKPYSNPEPSDVRAYAFPRKSGWATPGSRRPMECHGTVWAPGGATHTGHNVSGVLLGLAKRKGRVANGRGKLPLTLGIYLCQRNFPYCQALWARHWSKCRRPVFSVQSLSHIPDSLWPHGLQHARLPCPSPTPGACSNSCPSSWWCHSTISSSVISFSSCLQSFPAWGSFPVSQFFTPGGQSIGVSASASVLPMSICDWFPLGLSGWISLPSKGLKSLLQHQSSKASILLCSAFFTVQLSHPYMTTGKTIALTKWTFVSKVMSLLFNMQWAKSLY